MLLHLDAYEATILGIHTGFSLAKILNNIHKQPQMVARCSATSFETARRAGVVCHEQQFQGHRKKNRNHVRKMSVE